MYIHVQSTYLHVPTYLSPSVPLLHIVAKYYMYNPSTSLLLSLFRNGTGR